MEEKVETLDVTENVTQIPQNVAEKSKELPRRAIKFDDGTIIYNLKVTYKNLFEFQNSYDKSKDLMEALIKKQSFDYETMVQMIYVGYLGALNPTDKKLDYMSFLESISLDYKRDMNLFKDLTGMVAEKN